MEPNIIKGREIDFKIRENLGLLTVGLLGKFSNVVLQIDAENGHQLTGSSLLKKAKRLAKFLREKGVRHGDFVAIVSENCLEFPILTVACFIIGATLVPLNPEYTVGELENGVGVSKPKIIFTSPTAASKLLDIKKKCTYVEELIILDTPTDFWDFISFDKIIEDAEEDILDSMPITAKYDPKETVALILFSSGTTGKPKGVMITHQNITACLEISAQSYIQEGGTNEQTGDANTIIAIAPFFHSFGFFTMLFHLLGGKRMLIMRKFKPKLFLDTVVKYQMKYLIVPPPIAIFLVKNPLARTYNLSCVEQIFVGSASLGKEIEMDLKKRFTLNHSGQSYGLTETTWAVISNPFRKAKVGSIGVLVPGMMAKIVNRKGSILPPGERGELCLKGPMVMKGYLGDIEATRGCIDSEGWLHTGDIAFYDETGYFFIVDRLKELIKYQGFQVAPSELEDLLLSHPSISDAAVIGKPDAFFGEIPMAFVVRKLDDNISEAEIQDFVCASISPHKWLRGGIIFVEEIPRNHTGKILRRVLKERSLTLKSRSKL